MLKVDIKHELTKGRTNIVESPSLKEAQLLLEGTAIEERHLLKEAGLDSNFAEIETEVGINLERKVVEDRLGEKAFTIDEIKALCVKYKLKMLPSQRFKGVIDPVLGAKLVRFFKEKGIDSAKHEAHNNLFIMAPAKAFNLDEKRKPVPVDPVLLYKTHTKEGPMFTIIHKWGNDFSITRRILGMMFANTTSYFATRATIIAMLVNCVFATFVVNPFHWLPILLSASVGTLIMWIHWMSYNAEDNRHNMEKYKQLCTDSNWNNAERYI